MSIHDLEFKEGSVAISIPETKNNLPRTFLVTEESWITLIQQYAKLRPLHTSHDRFFVTYRSGRCTVSPIGINTIGEVPKKIAFFLNLPNPKQYTGHCFRRSSASHIANQGGDLLAIKKHGEWKSSSVAEGYVDESLQQKKLLVCSLVVRQPQSHALHILECLLIQITLR